MIISSPLWTHTEYFARQPPGAPALWRLPSASVPFPPLLLGIQSSCETFSLYSTCLLCLLSCVFSLSLSLCFGLVIFYWFIFDSPILYSAWTLWCLTHHSVGSYSQISVVFRSRMLNFLSCRFQFPAQNFCLFNYCVHFSIFSWRFHSYFKVLLW